MEPGALEFLKRVGFSIGLAFTWLVINAVAAIKGDNAFIEDHIRLKNILFYTWLVISIVLLVKFMKKIWSKQESFGPDRE